MGVRSFELVVESAGPLTTGRALQLRRNPEPFVKHFLDLGGLGVRDLSVDGDDLIVLAGPTMLLDGPVRLLRWPDGAKAGAATPGSLGGSPTHLRIALRQRQ